MTDDPVAIHDERRALLQQVQHAPESVRLVRLALAVDEDGDRKRHRANDASPQPAAADDQRRRSKRAQRLDLPPDPGGMPEARRSGEFAYEVNDHVPLRARACQRSLSAGQIREREIGGAVSNSELRQVGHGVRRGTPARRARPARD